MSLSEQALLHQRPGRKRARGVRRGADGISDGEPAHVVKSIVTQQRIRAGARPEDAESYLYSFTIGRLFYEDAISQEQFHTADSYLRCVIDNARIYGIPSPHPRAHDMLRVSAGSSCAAEPDPDLVAEIKGKFRDARRTLLDCGRGLGIGGEVNRVTYGAVVLDWPMGMLMSGELQNLRCGLNSLRMVFRKT